MTSLTIAANALGGPAATAPRMTTAPVFRPGDRGYDAERAVFNLAVDHRPRLVVGARGPADVVAAVRLAGASGLAIGVLATGHGAAAAAADGALLINTRRMNRVEVDPVGRTATIGAGARWERVLAETVPHGLAPLNGSSPHVGAIGYTLGGGIGLLGRRYGYAADLVQELEVVTADGVLRRVSADRDPDLFWALRGGKGNFGVVVSMRIELVPVARLFGGGLYFAADAAADLLHTYRQWTSTVPEEMASSVMLAEFPHDPALPEPLRGRFVAHLRIAYSGSAEEGERLVRPLRALGRPLLDTLTEMPYGEVGSIHHDSTVPEAAYDRSLLLRELDAAATNVILSRATPEAQPPLVVELRHHGGAYARPPRVPNAVGGRDAAFTLFSGSAMEPGHLAEVRRSHDELHELLRPWSTGGAVLNFMGTDDLSPARVRAAFTARDYRRLTEIKATYDPENVFRVNHNIPPAGRGSSRSVGTSASDRRTQPPAIRT